MFLVHYGIIGFMKDLNKTETYLLLASTHSAEKKLVQAKLAKLAGVSISTARTTQSTMKCIENGMFIGKRCEDNCPWAQRHSEQPNSSVCPSSSLQTS